MGARSCEASEAWLCSEASEKNVLPSSELEAGEPASDAAGGCCLLDGVTDGVAFVDEAESVGVPNVASRSTASRAPTRQRLLRAMATLGPLSLWLLGLPAATLFLAAGVGHFREAPKFFGIMKGMPLERWHPAANYITGAAELWLGAELAIAPLLGAQHEKL